MFCSFDPVSIVRIILFDKNGRIAFVGWGAYILPGGGVHEGESLEDAVHRESMEEVGCKVEIIDYIGYTEDFRGVSGIHQTTHCFSAKIIGEKGRPTTEQEDEVGMPIKWLPLDENLFKLLKSERDTHKGNHYPFNIRTHITFLEEYLRRNNEK